MGPPKKHNRNPSQTHYSNSGGFSSNLSSSVGYIPSMSQNYEKLGNQGNRGVGEGGQYPSYRNAQSASQYYSRTQGNQITDSNEMFDEEIDPGAELDKVAREVLFNPESLKRMNEKALQRIHPAVTEAVHIVPYAVVYSFSRASQSWEKCGIEGTLFVVELSDPSVESNPEMGPVTQRKSLPKKRFAVMIMNRRGLENFCVELEHPIDVDVTAEYIMLQGVNSLPQDSIFARQTAAATGGAGCSHSNGGNGNDVTRKIFGLWIFTDTQTVQDQDSISAGGNESSLKSPSEKSSNMLKKTAAVMRKCAQEAEKSQMGLVARAASIAAPTPAQPPRPAPQAGQSSQQSIQSQSQQIEQSQQLQYSQRAESNWNAQAQPSLGQKPVQQYHVAQTSLQHQLLRHFHQHPQHSQNQQAQQQHQFHQQQFQQPQQQQNQQLPDQQLPPHLQHTPHAQHAQHPQHMQHSQHLSEHYQVPPQRQSYYEDPAIVAWHPERPQNPMPGQAPGNYSH